MSYRDESVRGLLFEAGLDLVEAMPDGVLGAVAGAVGAVGILGFALSHVIGRRRLSLVG